MTNKKDLLDKYTLYLLSESQNPSCIKISQELGISHDIFNRLLQNSNFTPYDLFKEIKPNINLEEGIISVDDSVEDKLYSQLGKSDLASSFYSGKHHKVVKGINLVTLFYTDT
jgi:hypothetical protein